MLVFFSSWILWKPTRIYMRNKDITWHGLTANNETSIKLECPLQEAYSKTMNWGYRIHVHFLLYIKLANSANIHSHHNFKWEYLIHIGFSHTCIQIYHYTLNEICRNALIKHVTGEDIKLFSRWCTNLYWLHIYLSKEKNLFTWYLQSII